MQLDAAGRAQGPPLRYSRGFRILQQSLWHIVRRLPENMTESGALRRQQNDGVSIYRAVKGMQKAGSDLLPALPSAFPRMDATPICYRQFTTNSIPSIWNVATRGPSLLSRSAGTLKYRNTFPFARGTISSLISSRKSPSYLYFSS